MCTLLGHAAESPNSSSASRDLWWHSTAEEWVIRLVEQELLMSDTRHGIHVWLGRHVAEVSRETLLFPAMQSGGRYSGRGALFPVESCTKQTQIPAKSRMVYLEQCSFSFKTWMKKKNNKELTTVPISSPLPSPVPIILDRRPKFSDLYCTHMPMCWLKEIWMQRSW